MLKKCIGIVSYFPDNINERMPHLREKRIARFNQLLNRLNDLWPTIDILIVAQNWKDYQLPEITNHIEVIKFDEPLHIIGARTELRKEFLKRDFDYIIMLDDDAIIEVANEQAANDYIEEIDNHPDGFCFIHSPDHWHTMDDYARAPLNLCAISRFIYEREPIPNVDLQKNEALEDDIYAVLLHTKWAEHEFMPAEGIRHTHNIKYQYLRQFTNPDQITPSTWCDNINKYTDMFLNTTVVLNYIVAHKELPDFEKMRKENRRRWMW